MRSVNDQQRRWDDLVYPGTQTLRNLFGIKDPDVWAEYERRFSSLRESMVPNIGFVGEGVADELRQYHAYVFGELYEWAGEFRTVDMVKSNVLTGEKTVFAEWSTIEDRLAELDEYTHRLEDAGFDEKVVVLAYLHSEINEIHPFREGNGRVTRAFMLKLAERHDVKLSWEDADAAQLLAAVESMRGEELNQAPWVALYRAICEPATWDTNESLEIDDVLTTLSPKEQGLTVLNALGLSAETFTPSDCPVEQGESGASHDESTLDTGYEM